MTKEDEAGEEPLERFEVIARKLMSRSSQSGLEIGGLGLVRNTAVLVDGQIFEFRVSADSIDFQLPEIDLA